MIYTAEIVNGLVVRVLVVDTVEWAPTVLGGTWVECKMDGSIRGCYPAPGYLYDPVLDVFTPSPEIE
jgi:hypothetical protein